MSVAVDRSDLFYLAAIKRLVIDGEHIRVSNMLGIVAEESKSNLSKCLFDSLVGIARIADPLERLSFEPDVDHMIFLIESNYKRTHQ